MMASSSIIILGLHSYWLVLFLIMATILDKRSICFAQRVTCGTLGCYSEFKPRRNCHCDAECHRHGNCCDDFVDCESCEDIGCGSSFNRSRLCHCNHRCREFGSCCSDYNNTCDFTKEQTTMETSPKKNFTIEQTTIETPEKDSTIEQTTMVTPKKNFTIEQTTMETPEKGTNALVAITTSSVLVVIVAAIGLVFCIILRRKRIHKANEEKFEDRNYYEVENTNERSYDRVLPNDQGKRYESNIRNNTSTSATNNYEGQFVVNVAYESYR
ncbi:Proteoglycan 4 [Holothuria leucospilota]|uniref:Proteoglycan 4 n=1 Tax=Holothuria leucospilota TaxID=206669 RepID=A0A9Q1BTD1_HOLLE|nr:Proteoglycan 4 [Holothuria leucospilota]